MVRLLLLCTVLASIDPSFQQLQALKSPEFVSVGGTVTLSCLFSSGNIGDGNYPLWLQQKEGAVPKLMMYTTSTRPSDVPARFSGSRSGNTMSLTITGAQVEDEADYYCVVWTGSAWIFGGGTQVIVTGQPAVPPSVHLFPPSSEELQTKKAATLVCLVNGFSPGAIQVSWLVDGNEQSAGVETTKPIKQGDKYVASSYLTTSEANWKSHEDYACKVTHDGKSYEKSVKRSDCS